MIETGVIHGRFQILHNDHLKYLLAGKERCRHLVIGITNPDPTLTKTDHADTARSSAAANPLSYYERYCMVRGAMEEQGYCNEISIVPFPINLPELYQYYVPLDATFLTIYDAWGEKKKQIFEKRGLLTDILWRKRIGEKGLSSTAIRKKMVEGEEWENLLPDSVVKLVYSFHIIERLKRQKEEVNSSRNCTSL